ncbi:MAG: GNAT family N-acetyltransferase [Caulobacteraceae bacterium]
MPFVSGGDIVGGLRRLGREGLVSIVLVADPLASPGLDRLASEFDLCRPFKTHLLIDRAIGSFAPSKHHRDRIRRGRRRCEVRRVLLGDHLDEWRTLYGGLTMRHQITGSAAFSQDYFAALAGMSQITAFTALVEGRIAGMTLWFEHGGVAYSHLTAADASGYANGANYALNDAAIEYFGSAEVIDLGGGAGIADDPDDGLARFKRGFANSHVVAMLCGAVLDRPRYDRLSAGMSTTFFPAYRA